MLEISRCLHNLGVPMQTNFTIYMLAQGHRHTLSDTGWVHRLHQIHRDQMTQRGTCLVWQIPLRCIGFTAHGQVTSVASGHLKLKRICHTVGVLSRKAWTET